MDVGVISIFEAEDTASRMRGASAAVRFPSLYHRYEHKATDADADVDADMDKSIRSDK